MLPDFGATDVLWHPVIHFHHQSIFPVFRRGIFLPLYPNPSSHGHNSLRRCSNFSTAPAFCSVRAMSSNPFSKQCLRNGSVVKGIAGFPFCRRTSCFSRSTSSSSPASASSASALHSSAGRATGNMPFCIVLLQKMSAKLGAIMQRIPKSFLRFRGEPVRRQIDKKEKGLITHRLHGACSRELPHPKFSPVHTRIFAWLYGARFSTKSVSLPVWGSFRSV